MVVTTPVRWTVADLELLPLEDGTRYEIIDVFMSEQPQWHHQNTCNRSLRR